jgi:LmbE family N-acetylglucosaminyl deacetylase
MLPKKTVAIFAHPDDESFAVGGTLAKYADRGEVYLVCVTNGNDKTNGRKRNLPKIRRNELRKAAKILGIKRVYFLDYEDGELNNSQYHAISKDIKKILVKVKPDTLITFEMRGVSGHIDHIVCSMVASYLFRELTFIKRIMYAAADKNTFPNKDKYFIFVPDGFKRSEFDKVEKVSKYWDKKIDAIKAHKSQLVDVEKTEQRMKNHPKEEYFFIKKR